MSCEPQMEPSQLCIYPGPHTTMSVEHYLPEGLGKFRGVDELEGFEQLNDRVCAACNNAIGRSSEEQFLRVGPVAFFRWMLDLRGKDGPQPSPFYRGASGAPPILAVGRASEYPFDLLWEIRPGSQDCFPLRQVVVHDQFLGTHPIPILDSARTDPTRIREQLKERGLENARPIHSFAAPEEIPWVSKIVEFLGGTLRGDWVTTTFEARQIDVSVKLQVTSAFFRAVAKIGFHYALKVFPDLRGTEPEFDSIKEFIWMGGEFSDFIKQRETPVVENLVMGARPANWAHILLVDRTYERLTAFAQFFIGPQALPPTYEISIGRNPSIIATSKTRAHIFEYPDSDAPVGSFGIISDLWPSRVRRSRV